MSSGSYTTEQCCLRMVAGERNHSQFPVSMLHSQMQETGEVKPARWPWVQAYFFLFSLNGLLWPLLKIYQKRSYKDTLPSSWYFSFLFLSFVSKVRWLFHSHCDCKSKFLSNTALDTQHFSACVFSLHSKGFSGHPRKMGNNALVFLFKARQLDTGQINLIVTFLPLF